jgi:hypothetical protein
MRQLPKRERNPEIADMEDAIAQHWTSKAHSSAWSCGLHKSLSVHVFNTWRDFSTPDRAWQFHCNSSICAQ